jgi:hypothetical protein
VGPSESIYRDRGTDRKRGVEPEPSEGVEDPEPATTFVDGGCARAATVGVAVGRPVKSVTAGRKQGPRLAARHWLRPSLDRIRVCRWGAGSRRTSCFKPPAPTFLYSTR